MARTATSGRFLLRDMGKSILFNGTSDRFTLPITPSTTAWSFAMWIRISNKTAGSRIMDYADSGNSGGLALQINGSLPLPRVSLVIFNLTSQDVVITTSVLPFDTWVHLGVTYAVNNANFYVNGVNIGNDTSITMTAPTQTFSVGRRSSASNSFFGGQLDDFMFVNSRAITATEVVSHYTSGVAPSDATCVLNFNDNVTDQTANGNNATLTGTSYSTSVPYGARIAASGRVTASGRIAP